MMCMRRKLNAIINTPDIPTGFTELEYIETSGVQNIYPIFGHFDKETGIWKDIQPLTSINNDNFPYFSSQNTAEQGYWYVFPPRWQINSTTKLEWYWYKQTSSFRNVISIGDRYQSGMNWLGEKVVFLTSNGTSHSQTIGEGLEYSSDRLILLGGKNRTLWYGIKISRGKEVAMDFVPVLDLNGVPCMYDKVNRRCFRNTGKGTFGYKIKNSDIIVAPTST